MTFSIVARNPKNGDLGIAVQSKFPSVGSLVPWISVESGAIATQAFANLEYGRSGLQLLKTSNAQQTLNELLQNDPMRETRQVGIVDLNGNAVSFTGKDCFNWAGSKTGEGIACQGNILVSQDTVDEMFDTYHSTEGDLAEKLITALEAGQNAGGDNRGQQSGNLLVYRKNGGYGGGSDVYIDVRVDDHPKATSELRRVFELYSMTLLERDDPKEITELTDDLYDKIGNKLLDLKYLPSDDFSKKIVDEAFFNWIGTENFENKIRKDNYVWNSILDYLFSM